MWASTVNQAVTNRLVLSRAFSPPSHAYSEPTASLHHRTADSANAHSIATTKDQRINAGVASPHALAAQAVLSAVPGRRTWKIIRRSSILGNVP